MIFGDQLSIDEPAVDPRTGRRVMPLAEFPAEKRAEFKRLAALPKPPPRWRSYWFGELPSRAFYEWYAERGIDPLKRREPIPDFMISHSTCNLKKGARVLGGAA